ncbi:hypothetical protein C1J03_04570 [Sulfitobacter sp. SK012]|uniref:glycosyltransferase family 10 domain-containing protein n=1 Tax=Sulfitobacter sp. SK012 TaxID=1389005 RepID=UPI000E0BEAAE|nr:glycosyltransferase family 10 [Sulfitobacter sp. SK012]AXI45374.1 hypothetical protein C1J03_04570 [Sulfitobacter sp. SK012]
MNDPAIAVLPYGGRLGKKLAALDLDDLDWPLGRPARLAKGTVGDLAPGDHLIVFPKTAMHYQPRFGTSAHVSIMVVEPSVIHGRHLKWLRLTWRRFFRVFSYNEALLAAIPNGLFLAYGTSWVPNWQDLDVTKTAMCSLIASAKRDQPGHALRHEVIEAVQAEGLDVTVLGRGYAPFENKSDGLAPYRFSVVIENVREQHYFSEKLVDAVLCETVPIYWGCPNIADHIDTGGMIICESKEALLAAIRAATGQQYEALLPALKATKPQAAAWDNLELRAAQTLKASL